MEVTFQSRRSLYCMSKSIRIGIVGGGLGGSCLANVLVHIPHLAIEVYEAKPAFSERGASVGLHHAALHALEQIFVSPYDLLAKAGAVPTNASRLLIGSGPRASETVLDLEDGSEKKDGLIVQRSSLLRELLAPLPEDILHPNKKVESVKPLDSGKVQIAFEDGTVEVFDAVVGADGIFSAVRKHVHGDAADEHAASPAGFWDCRNLVPFDQAREVLGEQLFREDRQYGWIGDKGFIMHDVAENRTVVQCVLCMIEDDPPKDRKRSLSKELLTTEFCEWMDGPIAPKMIDLMLRQADPNAYSQWEHKTTPTYAKDRVCIMGDAAHAMTPFMASGAATAFEDAMILGTLFNAITSPGEIADALKAYDAVRRPRCQRVIDASKETGYMMCGQNQEAGLDPKKLLEIMGQRWVFIRTLDVVKHKEEALEKFKEIKGL